MPSVRRPAEEFRDALEDLLNRCSTQGISVELYLVGGAAFAFGHEGRQMITDVDAIIRCRVDLTELIAEVGRDHDLESNWLNNQVKAFVSPVVDDPEPVLISEHGESRITAASMRVLAAMKIRAGRPTTDRQDLAYGLEKLQITDEEEAIELYEWYFPEDALRASARDVLRSILEEQADDTAID